MKVLIVILLLGVGLYIFMNLTATNSLKHVLPTPVPSVTALPNPSSVLQAHIGPRTKTDNCLIVNSMQDTACTPGQVVSTLTKEVLCSASFSTKSIRNVPTSVKNQVYAEYGITSHSPGEYEVDHLISLELGGSNDIANLWPEAADPRPGFHEKDLVENYLHKQVCDGAITLEEAQSEIANNWFAVYQTIQSSK